MAAESTPNRELSLFETIVIHDAANESAGILATLHLLEHDHMRDAERQSLIFSMCDHQRKTFVERLAIHGLHLESHDYDAEIQDYDELIAQMNQALAAMHQLFTCPPADITDTVEERKPSERKRIAKHPVLRLWKSVEGQLRTQQILATSQALLSFIEAVQARVSTGNTQASIDEFTIVEEQKSRKKPAAAG